MNSQIVNINARQREYNLGEAKGKHQGTSNNEAELFHIYLVLALPWLGYTFRVAKRRADKIISIINAKNFIGISFFTSI